MSFPFELYQKIKSTEPEYIQKFNPNKRFRELDLEMNLNPIIVGENENPEINHPLEEPKPKNPLLIYNRDFNPFIQKQSVALPKTKKFNMGIDIIQKFIPVLDEISIKKYDLRFSKVCSTKINSVAVSVKNFAELRNKLLGMFYRKVLRPENGVSYCKDGLAIHGVGSKQNILAIINLAKILHFRLNIKLRLRNGQFVVVSV